MSGEGQKIGGFLQILAVVAAIAATIIGTPAAGAAVLTASESLAVTLSAYAQIAFLAGAALTIAGNFLTPYEPDSPSDSRSQSPAYGVRLGVNPTARDSVIPVVYSARGRKVSPPYIAAFTTPRGYGEDTDYGHILSRRGQSLSAAWVVAAHECAEVGAMTLGEEPVFIDDRRVSVGTGNGSRREFELPGRRLMREGLRVWIETDGGATIADVYGPQLRSIVIELVTGRFLYTVDLDAEAEQLDDSAPLEVYYKANYLANYTRVDREEDDPTGTGIRPIVWIENDKRLRCYTQGWRPRGGAVAKIRIDYTVRAFATSYSRARLLKDEKGRTSIRFGSNQVPAASQKIFADVRRLTMRGTDVQIRHGTDHQQPLRGFDVIRATTGLVRAMPKNLEVTFETELECDDVLFTISSESEFRQYTEEGETKAVRAQITVKWRQPNASGNYTGAWTKLRNPNGANSSRNQSAYEFNLESDSASLLFWSFSLRGLIERDAKRRGNYTTLNSLRRARFQVTVNRTNPDSTHNLWRDDIQFWSYTEIVDEFLALNGFALIAAHNIPAEKVPGGLPQMSCEVVGKPNVSNLGGPNGPTSDYGPVWAQSWAAYAAADLIVSHYGGGEHYTVARNIDVPSFVAAAEWQQRLVDLPGGTEEPASVLDIVLDTRASLMDAVAKMLRPSFVIPFLDGDVWRCAIDGPVDLVDAAGDPVVPVIYDDSVEEGRTIEKSAGRSGEEITSRATEVVGTYHDELLDWRPEPLWWTTPQDGTERRTKRVDLQGVTRRTEATRVVEQLHRTAQNAGDRVTVKTGPAGLVLEAGDVFRFVASRLFCDRHYRVVDCRWGSLAWIVDVAGKEYVPANYGQLAPSSMLGSLRRELPTTNTGRIRTIVRATPVGSSVPTAPRVAPRGDVTRRRMTVVVRELSGGKRAAQRDRA